MKLRETGAMLSITHVLELITRLKQLCNRDPVTGESAKLADIQRFKSRFGARLDVGYLWKMDLSRKHCVAFDSLLRLRNAVHGRFSGRGDLIDQERSKPEGVAVGSDIEKSERNE